MSIDGAILSSSKELTTNLHLCIPTYLLIEVYYNELQKYRNNTETDKNYQNKVKKTKSYYTLTCFWIAIIVSLLPAIVFLVADASDWPNNWDDFHRLFNGVSQDHKLISYGIEQSKIMMKLAVHDPILTISNRLRFQFPLLSILTEVALILSPIFFFSRLAYLRNELFLCISMSMGFSGLMVIHTVFLPPAAYPLGFSLAFCSSLFISLEFIRCLELNNFPFLQTVIMISIEQLSFIFYASCYLQSFLITLIFFTIIILYSQHLWTRRKLFTILFIQMFRFAIFPLLTLIWRWSYNSVEAESFAVNLTPKGIIYAILKWSFGGTIMGNVLNMGSPKIKLIDNIQFSEKTFLVVLLITILFGISLTIWSQIWSNSHQLRNISPDIKNSLFKECNLYVVVGIIGLSIYLSWSLPIVSKKYYVEMQNQSSQIFAAMRYSSYGVILMMTSGIAYLFKLIDKLRIWDSEYFIFRLYSRQKIKILVSCFLPFWIYSGLLNLNSLQTSHHFVPNGTSLNIICSNKSFTSSDYQSFGDLVPSSVIKNNVENWLPSLKTAKKTKNDNLQEFIGKTFIHNALNLCP